MNKEEHFKKLTTELERAITDIKKKYGNELDTKFLKHKLKEIINNSIKE